jgi:allophanate hydrolase
VEAEPVELNRRLGTYMNFVNLLDLAAVAVPASMRADGIPFGVTLIGPAGSDLMLAELAQRFHAEPAGLGALGLPLPPAGWPRLDVAVSSSARMSGLPLTANSRAGARLVSAPARLRHRLFALPGTAPPARDGATPATE